MSGLALNPGTNVVVHWEDNPRQTGSVKSNRVNGQRTKKIVLCTQHGPRPRANQLWICAIERITNPRSETRGAIIVRPIAQEIDGTFPGVWVDPLQARLMTIVLQNREKNLMLEGDQGIGKSTISEAVAAKLGWEFRKVSGGQIKKFVYMTGRVMPKTKEDALTFAWADSQLIAIVREAIANPQQIYLCMIDEYTRIDEDARDVLLDVIEGRKRQIWLSNGDVLQIPENLRFMAAGNEGDGFTIKKQDPAAKDRWVILKIRHMPAKEELRHCLERYQGCAPAEMNTAISIINLVRSKRHEPTMRLSRTVSTRAAQNVAMFLAAGIDLKTALLTAVANQFPGNPDDPNSEGGRVTRLITDEVAKIK